MTIRIYFICLIIIIFSCNKNQDSTPIAEDDAKEPVREIIGTVAGIVTGEFGSSIGDATVTIGANQQQTNSAGYFIFTDVELNTDGTFIKVEKEGYHLGATRIFPVPNARNYIKFKLLKKYYIGSLSEDGGSIEVPYGAKINFEPSSFKNAEGQVYQGEVRVFARWLNPGAYDLFEIMPGNLQGIDQNGRERALGTYGMLAVEITSRDREPLQLDPDKPATISIPVPPSLLAEAPSEIPLWYFDETDGMWKEEGVARLEEGNYIGKVQHFSFWNCDVPFPLVEIKGKVIGMNEVGLENLKVKVTTINSAAVGFSWTNEDGNFAGKVPANESLKLEVFDVCSHSIIELQIGPLNEDTNLGNLVTQIQMETFTGRLVDCNGEPIEIGLLEVYAERSYGFFFNNADGEFIINIPFCEDYKYSLRGFDFLNDQWSTSFSLNSRNELNAGDIVVCDGLTGPNISINLEGSVLLLQEVRLDSLSMPDTIPPDFGSFTFFKGSNQISGQNYFGQIGVNDLVEGLIEGEEKVFFSLRVDRNGQEGGLTEYTCVFDCSDFRVTIERIGAIGEYITGRFEGTISKTESGVLVNPSVPIDGRFKVIRTY